MNSEENKNGNTWKTDRYFSTFEEANQLRNSIKARDVANLWEVKVKRCGTNGEMFVVKSRMNEKAVAELKEIEEKMLPKKKNKKQ